MQVRMAAPKATRHINLLVDRSLRRASGLGSRANPPELVCTGGRHGAWEVRGAKVRRLRRGRGRMPYDGGCRVRGAQLYRAL